MTAPLRAEDPRDAGLRVVLVSNGHRDLVRLQLEAPAVTLLSGDARRVAAALVRAADDVDTRRRQRVTR